MAQHLVVHRALDRVAPRGTQAVTELATKREEWSQPVTSPVMLILG
jgi:hypothetical protein